ncbi:hypothetical protein FNH05_16330 [Amycolatopsis rhizosphaerae]|uniref:Uncharacterized protein n=1 Tax=Amycolatopsis rhizosphaerae TaxID=2053003 RepID=A0A558CMZ3_9PSEU|nr:hypothetical protein [Amycolatopsis rhizosphaerae]TVT50072.1 hypothetical protein FNH05_16330 [Amycolatopsis rhizosphaerae]
MWNGEPQPPEAGFEDSFEGTFTTDTGRVVLGTVTGSPSDRSIELPRKGTYQIRAYRSRSLVLPDDPSDVETSVQRWLIQIW